MSGGAVAAIIIVVILLIGGGAVAAYFALRKGKASYNLGDGTVMGEEIEFRDMKLTKDGNTLTFSGVYDNDSGRSGEVIAAIEILGGKTTAQLLSFTVPVSKGKGKHFSEKKTSSISMSGATLGTLVFQGSSDDYEYDDGTYPEYSAPTEEDSYPSGSEESYPTDGTEPESSSTEKSGTTSPPYGSSPYYPEPDGSSAPY